MAKDKCPKCPKCLPGWLVQFGDLMSLLLTFFILLLSMAVMDKEKVEEYFDIMKKSMGFISLNTSTEKKSEKSFEKDSNTEVEEDSESSSQAVETMKEVIESVNSSSLNEGEEVSIEEGKNEFTLDIPSTIIFDEGEYEIKDKMSQEFIAKIARVIRTVPQTFNIEVIGHTDTILKNSTIPRDDWDISALRSISVVKELIKNKIEPGLLKVSAYASYHKRSNLARDNRRVEIKFFSQDKQNDILDEDSFFDRLK